MEPSDPATITEPPANGRRRVPRLHFQPRLWSHLANYDRQQFQSDLGAGITVGIVALPLAMAFAIASGLTPQAGLWTAIIGSFIIAAFGGSSVQIGGPAGAFIVVVYGIIERYGLGGLLIATSGAGVLLFLMGWLRLGNIVRYVPVSIVIGFTNGIAVLIMASQLRDLLGVDIDHMPGDFFTQMQVIAKHIATFNPFSITLALTCFVGLVAWPKLFGNTSALARGLAHLPRAQRSVQTAARIPGPIVALLTLSTLAWLLGWPVETIGERFGAIPSALPAFVIPEFSWVTAKQLVQPMITLAALGAIESLLCARVADQMGSHPKHDPNQELMAQGIANFTLPFCGGMPVTGTIARTVTNIRAGARSPVSGLIHAATLLLIVLVAAPLASHIPLSVLAGILIFVAWNMGEWRAFITLSRFSGHYQLMLLSTFFVTVVFDLTLAIELGLALACVLFIKRQASICHVTLTRVSDTRADVALYGSLFFGSIGKLDTLHSLTQTCAPGCDVYIDASRLVALDTTGLDSLKTWHKELMKTQMRLHINGLQAQPASLMERTGFLTELASYDREAAPAAP